MQSAAGCGSDDVADLLNVDEDLGASPDLVKFVRLIVHHGFRLEKYRQRPVCHRHREYVPRDAARE
jgi:hypothetical protein